MRTPLGAFLVVVIMLLVDYYVFVAIRSVSGNAGTRTRTILYTSYWILSLAAIAGFLLFVFTGTDVFPKTVRTYLFAVIIALFMAKIVSIVFFIADDIRRLLQWAGSKFIFSRTEASQMSDVRIDRSVFLSWLGLAAGSTLFGSLIYGFSNKYNYTTKKVRISFENLPAGFEGMKIVHFSDVHAGSFTNKKAVEHGVQMIIDEQPDLVIFSGDLVNDRASEMDDYIDVFSKIKAPMGVFSTFGNHDYGDYVQWPSNGISKTQNLVNLAAVHKKLGWKLMMNEHVVLERNGDEIALIGIENWGAKARFPKYGDMKKATAGTDKYPFKILISHDPSHWDAQVRPQYSDIDLTLSGHTHGMQFGVDIPGFHWSPVQYIYKQWKGLYEEGKQKLYVNTGFGFIGYPGRVGILPEITVIELARG